LGSGREEGGGSPQCPRGRVVYLTRCSMVRAHWRTFGLVVSKLGLQALHVIVLGAFIALSPTRAVQCALFSAPFSVAAPPLSLWLCPLALPLSSPSVLSLWLCPLALPLSSPSVLWLSLCPLALPLSSPSVLFLCPLPLSSPSVLFLSSI